MSDDLHEEEIYLVINDHWAYEIVAVYVDSADAFQHAETNPDLTVYTGKLWFEFSKKRFTKANKLKAEYRNHLTY